jgi:hypothetical protein
MAADITPMAIRLLTRILCFMKISPWLTMEQPGGKTASRYGRLYPPGHWK